MWIRVQTRERRELVHKQKMRLQLSLLPFFSAFLLCHGGLWITLHWEQANFGLSGHVAEWYLWMNSEFSLDFFISAVDKSRQTQPNAHLTHWVISFQCIIKEKTKISANKYGWILTVFTVDSTATNPAKTYRPRSTTVKCHGDFAWHDTHVTVPVYRRVLS